MYINIVKIPLCVWHSNNLSFFLALKIYLKNGVKLSRAKPFKFEIMTTQNINWGQSISIKPGHFIEIGVDGKSYHLLLKYLNKINRFYYEWYLFDNNPAQFFPRPITEEEESVRKS